MTYDGSKLNWAALQALKEKVENIRKTLGLQRAAGFLRRRGVTFAEAHELILGFSPRLTDLGETGKIIPRNELPVYFPELEAA